jgi:hypothetical protein
MVSSLQRIALAMKLQTLFAVAVAGCSFSPGEPSSTWPAVDSDAPRVEIETPTRGTIAGDVSHVLVTGTAIDDSGVIATVSVNGVSAIFGADGRFIANVPVAPGTTLLRAVAVDAKGNRGEQTRAIVAGPMVDLDRHIDAGIRATLSSPALITLGHNTATFMESGGLTSIAQGMNPVVDVGGDADCLFGKGSITSITVGDADVLTGPSDGGIMVSAVLTDVHVGMHLQWSVSCLDGERDVEMTAERVSVQGLLTVGIVDKKLDIHFVNPNVQVTGFDPHLAAVPDTIVQSLNLDTAVSTVIGSVTGRLVVPIASQQLAPLDDTRTVEVAGIAVDVDVAPTSISFSPKGGAVTLETSARAHGDKGQFVFIPNIAPSLDMQDGFELAIADDAANQLLTSLWSVKVFDRTVDLASYGTVGKYYDSAELQLMVPPHVTASAHPLELTIGDWIATFKGNEPATVAIHATTSLYVTRTDAGKLQLAVSTPAVRIDVIDGGESLTKAQYDAIKEFAIQRVTEVGSAAVAALPVPTIGDAVPANLWLEPDSDSMLIAGDLKEGGL